jgi:hypothetical protein
MTEQTLYPLRLPRFLQEAVAKVAEREGTSIDQFIARAVAEKLSALDTQEFFLALRKMLRPGTPCLMRLRQPVRRPEGRHKMHGLWDANLLRHFGQGHPALLMILPGGL